MDERIWNVMFEAKFNEEYLCKLIKRYQVINWRYNSAITISSALGMIVWKTWGMAPFVSCVIITALTLLKSVKSDLIPSEKVIGDFNQISKSYSEIFSKYEMLFRNLRNDRIDNASAQKRFAKIESIKRDIDSRVNEIRRKDNKQLIQITRTECIAFFNSSFKID